MNNSFAGTMPLQELYLLISKAKRCKCCFSTSNLRPRRCNVLAKLFHFMALFLAMAELEQAQFCSWLTERVVIVVKVV